MVVGPGTHVHHGAFGPGRVLQALGDVALVEFFGEPVQVKTAELEVEHRQLAVVSQAAAPRQRVDLRRAYEAMNLGVVPPNPDELLDISIGGEEAARQCRAWLDAAPESGLCKVFFGDYGSGKSHHLRLCEAVALKNGWVVSFVEFDPKQADPAKPHLVYRAITSNLKFPERENGDRVNNLYDLVGEIRAGYDAVQKCRYLSKSQWFAPTLAALRFFSHDADPQYREVIDWLGGQPVLYGLMKAYLKSSGAPIVPPPSMPRAKETAEIYVFHLVVLNEICKALGYKGLLLILDEAEHVRGYNVRRRERANNFLDLLARSARPPLEYASSPYRNEHNHRLPRYWQHGPHFGLLVGLTEGDTFSDESVPLQEACLFLYDEDDAVRLKPPTPSAYKKWCESFLERFYKHYPAEMRLIAVSSDREQISTLLASRFAKQPIGGRTLRLWTKLASLVPSILMARYDGDLAGLTSLLDSAAREASGELLPWEI